MNGSPSNSVRLVMAAKGISIRDLATKTGLSYGYVSNLISGSKDSYKGKQRIESVLGVKIWSDSEIGSDQDCGAEKATEKALEQGTRKSQPGDLPLRPDAIGAGEAADIQRPTAASLPGSLCKERGEE
jgi:transcriptional regulator with XRE-family HTH domain